MFRFFTIGRRAALTLALLTFLALGATAFAPATSAAKPPRFTRVVGNVRDACTGARIGGATLIFTPVGTPELPPGPPTKVVTKASGRFSVKLDTANYVASVSAEGYAPLGGPGGDPVGIFNDTTGRIQHLHFVLHPPSPC